MRCCSLIYILMQISSASFWSPEVLVNKYICYLNAFEAIAGTVVRHIIIFFMISIANTRHLKYLTDDNQPLRASSKSECPSPLLQETAAIQHNCSRKHWQAVINAL